MDGGLSLRRDNFELPDRSGQLSHGERLIAYPGLPGSAATRAVAYCFRQVQTELAKGVSTSALTCWSLAPALRGGSEHAAFEEMVLAQGLGDADRQAPRDEKGDGRLGTPVGRDHAPHLG